MMDRRGLGIKRGVAALALLCAPAFAGGDGVPELRLSGGGAAVRLAQPETGGEVATPDAPDDGGIAPARVVPRYGEEGSEWILFGGGAAYDFQETTDFNLNVGYSVFLVDDVEWLLELAGWYHAQDGDDAASINPAMEFRWHFYNQGDTTLYINGGIGLLAATDNVPEGGTSLDFTPRLGVGLTHRIGEGGTRLIAGVRWHHISNARFNGEDRNPSRDGTMLYVQFAVPF